MDEYRWNYHVPAFGGWDYEEDNLPYTQCFESARQAGFARFAADYVEDRDLYVAGDLYQNDILTPAVIVVPRRRRKGGSYSSSKNNNNNNNVKGVKKQEKEEYNWGGYSYDIKEPPSPIISPPKPTKSSKSKAVDEDLYKIPPEFLHVKPRKKKGFGLFSSCLQPACA